MIRGSTLIGEIFSRITTNDFLQQAYSDYYKSKADNYSNVINLVNDVVDLIDEESDITPIASDYRQSIRNLITSKGFNPGAQFTLTDGYNTFESICIDILNIAISRMYTSSNLNVITLKNYKDGSDVHILYEALIDDIKTTYHSMRALESLASASVATNPADRLTLFRDKLSQYFESSYSDYSNTSQWCSSLLASSMSGVDVLLNVVNSMNIQKTVEQQFASLNETDFSKYTGASPLGGIATAEAGKIVADSFKIAFQAVGKVFEMIGKSIGKIFSYIGKFFAQMRNPYDIETINDAASSYTIDGFYTNVIHDSAAIYIEDSVIPIKEQAEYFKQHFEGQWIKLDTIFAEIMLKVDNVGSSQVITGNVSAMYKLKPITEAVFSNFVNLWEVVNATPETTMHKAIRWKNMSSITWDQALNALKDATDVSVMYEDTNSSERDLYLGYLRSGFLLTCFSNLCDNLKRSTIDSFSTLLNDTTTWNLNICTEGIDPLPIGEIQSSYIFSDVPEVITNADFLQVASGYRGVNTYHICPENYVKNIEAVYNAVYWSHQLFQIVLLPILERYCHPLDFSFFPYRNGTATWNEARFRIKTDQENYATATNFIATAIIVAIVAAVAVTGIVLTKLVTRAIRVRRLTKYNLLQSKIWSGEKLDARDKRKLYRLDRKLNMSSSVSSGLLSSTFDYGNVSGSQDVLASYDEIISLIK